MKYHILSALHRKVVDIFSTSVQPSTYFDTQSNAFYLWSLNTELSRTIFSRSSMSSLGRSAVMKAFTVTEISSGSWVSERAV